MNGDEHFGDDGDGAVFEEGVHGVDDAADGGVFDRDEAQVGVAAIDFLEDGGDIGDGDVLDGGAEFFDAGEVREGALGPEIGDAEGFFEGEAAGHELAVDGFQARVGQRAADGFVGGADAFEHDFFTVGGVDGGAGLMLDFADVHDDAGAGVKQFDDAVIQLVGFSAGGRRGGRGGKGRGRACGKYSGVVGGRDRVTRWLGDTVNLTSSRGCE